jgi:hypothetical protein
MTTLTNCPHCGKPLVQSATYLQPRALALLRLIADMAKPEVEVRDVAAAAGRSAEGSFDRRLTGLRKRGLIERQRATESGHILAGCKGSSDDVASRASATRWVIAAPGRTTRGRGNDIRWQAIDRLRLGVPMDGVTPQGMRYKVWRSNKDKGLHLLCGEGPEAFNALPIPIRHLGPWIGSKEGDVGRLRLPFRLLMNEQGFVVIHAHVSKLQLETEEVRNPPNVDCPQCKGTGRVPIHHGLRDKECPRCGGRGWVKATGR